MTMRDGFLSTIDRALDLDPRIAVVLGDISAAQLDGAHARHPNRVLNLGIREQLMVSVAGGLALTGMRPVVHTFSSFLVERPFEQLKLDLVHQGTGAVLVSYGGSYDMPTAGRTHQSPGDVALIDSLPGWTVHVPGHPDEAERLLLESLPGNANVYLRLSAQENRSPHLGVGFQQLRRGRSGVVVAVGPVLDRVLAATSDADVTVLYASTIRPFDAAGLRAAVDAAAPDVVLVEPYLAGTSAHAVADALRGVRHRLLSLGTTRDHEVRIYGEEEDHDVAHGLDEGGIRAAVKTFLDG
ncbi:transketolase family protein [Amycolatopsis sp. CA-230715]|uniref:transketolase family protein n=1 Tax=Amycolatopsis sp. CA-230715 TaxID=2745196 RepID=UPI001C032F95|nr:transketolase [Amycolatopsis sp. CA-230715]QWF78095.1 putative 33.6 kDa protein in fasciation locus [Amycolatopsis sp. CA-230715]